MKKVLVLLGYEKTNALLCNIKQFNNKIMNTQIFSIAVQQGSRKNHTQAIKVCGVTFEVRSGRATGNEIVNYKSKPIGWDRLMRLAKKSDCGCFWVIEDEQASITFDNNKLHHGIMDVNVK